MEGSKDKKTKKNSKGIGFLESIYKNALFIAMKQKGLDVFTEQSYEVVFREHKIRRYAADIVVKNLMINQSFFNFFYPSIILSLIKSFFLI